MPLCLVLGDSTAVGTADALALQGIRCEVHARVGAHASGLAREWQGSTAPVVALIALGSNDVGDPRLEHSLIVVRARTRAPRVTWLVPYERSAALIVTKVAVQFGDRVVPLAQEPTRDGVHPTSYHPVASRLKWKPFSAIRKEVSNGSHVASPAWATRPPVRRVVVLEMQ
jgi:hypothetical protein